MNNQPIGIFDSGVGGLSILQEIKQLLPQESFIFVADQANVPYGGKSAMELRQFVGNIVAFLKSKNVKVIVAACNTATVYTIDYIREIAEVPVVGTVPVIKPLADITKTKKVAVLATPATSNSQYLKDLIAQYAADLTINNIGGTGLEELVETGD